MELIRWMVAGARNASVSQVGVALCGLLAGMAVYGVQTRASPSEGEVQRTEVVTLTASDGSVVSLRALPGGRLSIESGEGEALLTVSKKGARLQTEMGEVRLGELGEPVFGMDFRRKGGELAAGLIVEQEWSTFAMGRPAIAGDGVSLSWSSTGDGGVRVRRGEKAGESQCDYLHLGAASDEWGLRVGRWGTDEPAPPTRTDVLQLLWSESPSPVGWNSRLTLQASPTDLGDENVLRRVEIVSSAKRQLLSLRQDEWESVSNARAEGAGSALQRHGKPRLFTWVDDEKGEFWIGGGGDGTAFSARSESDRVGLVFFGPEKRRAAAVGTLFSEDPDSHAISDVVVFDDRGERVVRQLRIGADGSMESK